MFNCKKVITLAVISSFVISCMFSIGIFAFDRYGSTVNSSHHNRVVAQATVKSCDYTVNNATVNDVEEATKVEELPETSATEEIKENVDNINVSEEAEGVTTRQAAQEECASEVSDDPLTASKGVVNFNGHRETYYSQNVLPGEGLNIPGRHVADDGTVRDGDGYIVVAAHEAYLPRGAVVQTSRGPGKVYDSGCAYGTIDLYTNWG